VPIGNKLTDRYEVKQTLGQGGMGVVYWAYDTLIRRDVALKTIRDAPEQAALDQFHKECNILASISHPNIIEIFDIGSFQDEGVEKPYFVMPLLKGATLESLIRSSSRRLTVERTIEIFCQTCRGLQAAHERGLVHRDLKPSNIFVLEDDSVKIIDFGVAHMGGSRTASAPMGTLLYMSPEQIQLKPATALSDIFTLGVVAYEALTLRRPFDGATHRDIASAILHHIPPPASDLNPAVSPLLGRVVHKTMAKQPWNRFSTARDLADAFQKALRNDPIELFDAARIQPRIDRAVKAFESGDNQFASEILTELESEGHLVPAMAPLRRKIDQAIRQKMLAQLLESARTRMDDQEYPLALQKVQEALEIDPENAEALRLKHDIESNRSSRQVEEWFRLARQHLERFAFSHARQAVDNVLQLQPSDTQALELMADIQRREQQYLQLRQEKEKLYQSAMEAYEKFELSAALGKLQRVLDLDKRAPEISSAERGSSYQSFYNQVRSEQDANMSAYAEARRMLAEGNFNRAAEIVEEALKKYPGQALFQALKFDIEDGKRRKLSAYIAEVDRQVYAEPDPDKRVDILRGAAEQFPDEQYFQRTLKVTREKRDLVNSIVAKARRQEELGQFSEALGQWEILRTVYGPYPGLEFEIERVSKRRGQQTRDEAKGHWTEQIDRHIERREYAQAGALLREARVEFPGDAELEELGKLIRQGEERSAGAQLLVEQARALAAKGQFDEAARLLRQAYQTDVRDAAVRGLLVETLVQHARSLLDSDWKRAGELVQSALDLDSANSQARSMAALIADRKRDEAIDQCINRARQLQSGGDVAGALAQVEQAVAIYPTATRLVQLRVTLQRGIADTGRTQSRRADLEKLTLLEARAQTEQDPDAQHGILAGVRELAAKYLDDPEFQTALIAIEKRYVSLNRPAAPATLAAPQVSSDAPTIDPRLSRTEIHATPIQWADVPTSGKPKPAEAKTAEAQPAAKAPGVPPPVPKPPDAKPPDAKPGAAKPATAGPPASGVSKPRSGPETRDFSGPPPIPPPVKPPTGRPQETIVRPTAERGKRRTWMAIAAGVVLVLAAGVGTVLFRQHQQSRKPATPAVALFPVDIHTAPEGATILVNEKPSGTSNLQLKLAPGVYRINAVREGYQPLQTTVTVTAGQGASANMILQPLASMLKLLTDFASASITFDGHPQNNLQSGQLILDNVADGSHMLTVGSGTSGAAIHFDARDGAPPVVTSVEASKDTSAILITNLGSRGRIYSSRKTGSVTFDGKPVGQVDPLGVELSAVTPGDHEITIGEGEERRKVVYDTAPVPAITIYLNNSMGRQQSLGTLVVTTGEDDAVVSIDGKPQRSATRHGQLRIPNLQPKQYVVSVAKDGFQPAAEQHVTVNKGEEARVAFQLHPLPKIAFLHLVGALPGTQVLLDGKLVGTAGQDGGMPAVQVAPGSHRVELRKEEYKPKIYDLSFSAGENKALPAADVVLEATFGTLVVSVTPPNAQLTIQHSGEAQARPLTANSVHLPVGSYTVSAALPHFVPHSITFEIAAGSTKNVTLELAPEKVAPAPKPVVVSVGMSGWQDPQAWQPDGDHFTRRGGNLCLFKPQGAGTYTFTASMKHGKQLRWVAHVIDDKNYAQFELDGDYFYRTLVTNGKSKELIKRKHGLAMQPVGATLQITISPAGIVQRIQTPKGWFPLDSWVDPSLHEGRFGFLIRGHDEVNLAGFSFVGAE
jgi:serine/threonine protein kinase